MTEFERQDGEAEEVPFTQRLDEEVKTISEGWRLDPLHTENLGKFAQSAYRVRRIFYDFLDPTVNEKAYPGWDNENPDTPLVLNRLNYRDYYDSMATAARGIIQTHFKQSVFLQVAIKDVSDFLDKQMK
jgi:hypothetical protein